MVHVSEVVEQYSTPGLTTQEGTCNRTKYNSKVNLNQVTWDWQLTVSSEFCLQKSELVPAHAQTHYTQCQHTQVEVCGAYILQQLSIAGWGWLPHRVDPLNGCVILSQIAADPRN